MEKVTNKKIVSIAIAISIALFFVIKLEFFSNEQSPSSDKNYYQNKLKELQKRIKLDGVDTIINQMFRDKSPITENQNTLETVRDIQSECSELFETEGNEQLYSEFELLAVNELLGMYDTNNKSLVSLIDNILKKESLRVESRLPNWIQNSRNTTIAFQNQVIKSIKTTSEDPEVKNIVLKLKQKQPSTTISYLCFATDYVAALNNLPSEIERIDKTLKRRLSRKAQSNLVEQFNKF
jgi:hypothetical protein